MGRGVIATGFTEQDFHEATRELVAYRERYGPMEVRG